MSETRRYHDTIVLGTSAPYVLGGDPPFDTDELNHVARVQLAVLYPHSTLLYVEWTYAATMDEVEAWPLPHDCDDCRDGKVKAIAALVDGTATVIALGNMLCEEPVR